MTEAASLVLAPLLHLLQEYARHLGHLDIACEPAGTATGE
jgi:hypothetical protein